MTPVHKVVYHPVVDMVRQIVRAIGAPYSFTRLGTGTGRVQTVWEFERDMTATRPRQPSLSKRDL